MQIEPEQLDRVTRFIEKAKTRVSESDVAAGSGLDVATARGALYLLMRSHSCALDVGDDGTVVYDFGQKLQPLDAPTWRDRLRSAGRWLWQGFCWVYKASLAVLLVSYAVLFVVLIIGAAIAASAASKDEGPAKGAFHLVALIFRALFEFATIGAGTWVDTDRHGYPHQKFEPKQPVLPQREQQQHPKGFIASVYDFVLGPPRVPVDQRAQTREVASFVRDHGGVLTVSDVQALSGMDRKQAERFFARFVAEFEGAAEISEQGALYARLPELLRSTSSEHDEPVVYYWDEYEAPAVLTGNTAGKNVLVVLLAAFNLVCSLFVIGNFGLANPAILGIGLMPAVLFALFFLIPLLRAPVVWQTNRNQHRNNLRKRLFKAIFGGREQQVELAQLVADANQQATSEEKLDAEKLKPLLEETLRQVGGSLDIDTRDKLVADLERLRGETRAREEHALPVEQPVLAYTTRE